MRTASLKGISRSAVNNDILLTIQDPIGIFSDLSIPRTLTEIEGFSYLNCSATMTAFALMDIA